MHALVYHETPAQSAIARTLDQHEQIGLRASGVKESGSGPALRLRLKAMLRQAETSSFGTRLDLLSVERRFRRRRDKRALRLRRERGEPRAPQGVSIPGRSQ